MTEPEPAGTPTTITVVPLEPAEQDSPARFSGDSAYVEIVWGCALGPSAILILRRLCRYLGEEQHPLHLDLNELAASVGVKRAVALRSLGRLVDFGFAEWRPGGLAVATSAPPVSPRLLRRLSASAVRFHTEVLRGEETVR